MFAFLRTAGKLNNFVLRQSKIWPKSTIRLKEDNIRRTLLLCQSRCFNTKEFANPKTVARLAFKDAMPKSYTLIYRTNLPNYLMLSQVTLCLTLVLIACIGISEKLISIYKREDSFSTKEENVKENDSSNEIVTEKVEVSMSSVEKKQDQELLPLPSPGELVNSEDQEEFLLLLFTSLLVLTTAMYRLQRMIPVRIYIKQTKHCVAVLYGSVIPGLTTRHEFIAGTVKHLRKPNNPYTECVYKDATGKHLVLMDHFFRCPDDLNSLLGAEYHKKPKQGENDEDDEDFTIGDDKKTH